ncbi:MAG: hypothetical protein VR72_03860 [Clostridiaceae bacterium BRH_c20a]|nr:MAG: hypothetical protein VR72_03860 [Clostridiaceae bacterium BRH_c20a]
MERIYIRELEEGSKISATFLVKQKQLLPFKNKKGRFLHVILGDRTGEIEGRLWETAEDIFSRLNDKNIVHVEGEVSRYKDIFQINITSITPSESYVIEDLLPVSNRDINEMQNELKEVISSIENSSMRELLELIFTNEDLYLSFTRSPAAKFHHQAYIGGLLEHTLGVVKVADSLAGVYPNIDKDLLITGALLHDIGKIEELVYDEKIEYSDGGRLIGHLVLGVNIVQRSIDRIVAFPQDIKIKLIHMIVSHHGEYEWQSPKKPKFIEAMLLHYADMIDVHVDKFNQVKNNTDANEAWSGWVKGLDRYIYLK